MKNELELSLRDRPANLSVTLAEVRVARKVVEKCLSDQVLMSQVNREAEIAYRVIAAIREAEFSGYGGQYS
jgi:hypothetical protein